MTVAQGGIAVVCSCPHCDKACSNDIRPYVCTCGAVFGKRGWLTTVTVRPTSGNLVLDREARKAMEGRRAWSKLHRIELGTPEAFEKWKRYMPAGCECRKKVAAILSRLPPRYGSPEEWFEWTVEFHNEVNTALEKPVVSMERAYVLWRNRRPSTSKTRCIVSVAVGLEMMQIAKETWPLMQAYADRCGADFIGLDNDTEDWWGLEKFRTGHFASQYDETLFLDADCVVREQSPSIFDENPESIGVCDESSKFSHRHREWMTKERKSVESRSKVKIEDTERSVNSGVVLCRRSASGIWLRPKVDIGTMHCAEQVWVGKQIDDLVALGASLKNLDYRWNWQYWYSGFADGLENAYIVHFSSASNRLALIKDYIRTQQVAGENTNV